MPSAIRQWKRYLQDEIDASYLYEVLSQRCPESVEKETFVKLMDIENRHVQVWKTMIEERFDQHPPLKPSIKARWMRWLTTYFGTQWLRELMLKEEGVEVKSYLKLYKTSKDDKTRNIALRLAKDSAMHARQLNDNMGLDLEPWHRMSSGGMLRNVVYGFNDGLTANFGLIAGVIGAHVQDHFILISGLSGLLADALSMGSSGYLAAKSQREVYEHEKRMEMEEIQLMPELEMEELTIMYQNKGMDEPSARTLAADILKNPQQALAESVREELGIPAETIKPIKEAWITGIATAIGAFIPVLPFMFAHGMLAVGLSFGVAMLAHFAVGAARSIFTGLNLFKSGMEMFLVGMGVAGIGYLLGEALVRFF